MKKSIQCFPQTNPRQRPWQTNNQKIETQSFSHEVWPNAFVFGFPALILISVGLAWWGILGGQKNPKQWAAEGDRLHTEIYGVTLATTGFDFYF